MRTSTKRLIIAMWTYHLSFVLIGEYAVFSLKNAWQFHCLYFLHCLFMRMHVINLS